MEDVVEKKLEQNVQQQTQENRVVLILLGFYSGSLFSELPREIIFFILNIYMGCLPRSLVGNPFESWAIGGIIFSITAKRPVNLTKISVCPRTKGLWQVGIRRALGEWRQFENIDRPDYILPHSFPLKELDRWKEISYGIIQFRKPEEDEGGPTVVWSGRFFLRTGETISWYIDSFGVSDVNGEICGSLIRPDQPMNVSDEYIDISPVTYPDRHSKNVLYGNMFLNCGFIGAVEYELAYPLLKLPDYDDTPQFEQITLFL